jgi:hypothetical protein
MRGIPGIALAAATAVVMSDHCSAVAVAGPPAARAVAFGKQCAIGVTAGKDVVPGRCHLSARFGERRIPGEIDALAVEFINRGSDLDSLCVEPWTTTDPISRVDR